MIRSFVARLLARACVYFEVTRGGTASEETLDQKLQSILAQHSLTGRIEFTLEAQLGRPVNHRLADLARLLFCDAILGLKRDNTCAGCHVPTGGYADTQSIAISIDSNGLRNRQRSPKVINATFFPNLMWSLGYAAISSDLSDNRAGFRVLPDPRAGPECLRNLVPRKVPPGLHVVKFECKSSRKLEWLQALSLSL